MNDKKNAEQPSTRAWHRFQKLKIHPSKVKKRLTKAETWTRKHAQRFIVKRLDNLRDARREIVLWFLVVAAIITGIGVQSYLFTRTYTAEAPAPDGTYSEGIVGTLSTLNPLYASSAPEVAISKLLFSSLYKYDRSGSLTPDIATGTTIDAEGKVYTVKLRHDAKWQDGQPLMADDVVYTINTIKNPAANAPTSLASTWHDITVKQIDSYTVQFSLPAYAGFMEALTFPILPAHILSRIDLTSLAESDFSTNPVGSGPFEFKLLQSINDARGEKSIHMIANPQYYGRTVKLKRFAIHNYSSPDALVKALKASEVVAVADIDSEAAKKNIPANYQIDNYTIDDGVYLIFNTTQPALKDVSVRKAIQLALDTSEIRKAAGGDVPGLDLPFISSQVPNSPHADSQNIEKARALLNDAGWTLKDGYRVNGTTTLELQFKTIANPQYERVAKVIVRQLRAVGIKVDVTVVDNTNRATSFIQTVLQPRDYDMLLYELAVGADPDQYAYWHSSQTGVNGYNFANYSNPVADAALLTARDRLDTALRTAKYTLFAQQWLSDVPAVGLYQQTITYAHTKKSQSIDETAKYVTSSDRYMNIADWTVNETSVYKTP